MKRRITLAIVIGAVLALVAAPSGQALWAQTPAGIPAAPVMRTITSSDGYQFQVPADWQDGLPSGITVPDSSMVSTPESSPDGMEGAGAATTTLPFPIGGELVALTQFALTSSLAQSFGAQIVNDPVATTVTNADAASLTRVSINGGATDGWVLLAVRGQTLYAFTVFANNGLLDQDSATVQAILDSFQLTP